MRTVLGLTSAFLGGLIAYSIFDSVVVALLASGFIGYFVRDVIARLYRLAHEYFAGRGRAFVKPDERVALLDEMDERLLALLELVSAFLGGLIAYGLFDSIVVALLASGFVEYFVRDVIARVCWFARGCFTGYALAKSEEGVAKRDEMSEKWVIFHEHFRSDPPPVNLLPSFAIDEMEEVFAYRYMMGHQDFYTRMMLRMLRFEREGRDVPEYTDARRKGQRIAMNARDRKRTRQQNAVRRKVMLRIEKKNGYGDASCHLFFNVSR